MFPTEVAQRHTNSALYRCKAHWGNAIAILRYIKNIWSDLIEKNKPWSFSVFNLALTYKTLHTIWTCPKDGLKPEE